MRLRFALAFALAMCLTASALGQDQIGTTAVSAPVVLRPDPGRTPLATLAPGTSVRVIAREGDWYRVGFKDPRFGERTGYMLAEHLHVAPPPPKAPPAVEKSTAAPVPPAAEIRATTSAAPVSRNDAAVAAPTPPAVSTPAPRARSVAGGRLGGLSEAAVHDAVRIGLRQKGRTQGLRLTDSAQTWAALTAGGTGPTASNGFRLQVYTPLAWIRQLASDAAKEYRTFTFEDVGEEATEPVLRVIAYPDTPNTVSAGGMTGTSSVQHVVLRSEDRTIVVQPIFKEAFTDEVSNAMGGRATFEGLSIKFPMDAVRELRGPSGDREFFITVVGSTGEEKNFKVKKKHFDEIPM